MCYICFVNTNTMKKICLLGLFIAGFALSSHAQQASNTQSPVSIEVAKVAVTSAKPCCKKEGSAASCSKSESTAKSKECCKKKGSAASSAKQKCGGSEANSSAATEKKSCTTPNCQKPCCKKV